MFDGIPFIELPRDENLSQERLAERVLEKSTVFPNLSTLDIQALSLPSLKADYHMSERRRLMVPMPITAAARESLLFLESFSVAESDGEYYTKRSDINTYLLLYTYGGNGRLRYEGKEYLLGEGDGFLIACNKPHVYQTEGEYWEHGDLHFNGHTAKDFFAVFSQGGSVIFHSRLSFQRLLEQLLLSYQRIQPDRDLMIHVGLTELLSLLLTKQYSEEPGAMEETVRTLIRYMQAHFTEQITMDDLASLSNISKYHLSREFKRLTNYAPIEYLLMIRAENAATLLRNTDLPLAVIAERSGIGSEQYLSRLFRGHYGTTPGKYRKQGA